MGFEVTADPQRFEEALEWFRKRTVLTADEAARLGAEAGRRAFWIGGGLQLQQIQRVFDKLGKAVEEGTPFEEWRANVRKELRDDAHAETVFRNATQRALNAGRWRQMHEEGVARFRPFVLFDGIDDSRQSPICRECDGTVVPLGHPWLDTHSPLLHHRCRSSLRNLRRSEAVRRGITNVPPQVAADEGFGLSPEREPDWKPPVERTDPALLRELERKKASDRRPPKPQTGTPKEHDTKHWESEYSNYGEAAANVAWGRTMLERGLDRAPTELRAELERLQKAGVPGEYGRLILDLRRFDQNRPLRGQLLNGRQQYAVMLAEHSLTIQRGEAPVFSGLVDKRLTEAGSFYAQLADKSVQRPVGWSAIATRGERAYASEQSRRIELGDSGTPVTVHEIAHAIEYSDARALQRSLAFLRARTRGEIARKLRDLTGHAGYGENELARPDKFFNVYVGKDYGNAASEVTSMGYEAMAGDNVKFALIANAADGDQEMLFFLLGQLAGR